MHVARIIILLTLFNVLQRNVAENSVAYIFSHGLQCNQAQSQFYEKVHNLQEQITTMEQSILTLTLRNTSRVWPIKSLSDLDFWIIKQPIISFNYPDASEKHGYDSSKTSLGQENEIQALKNAYHRAQTISNTIVLMGMSRGASTILNFLGTYPQCPVAAVVIESPFDSIINTLKTKLEQSKVYWIPEFLADTAPYILFGKYNHKGICPITVTSHIKNDLPILIICSLEDSLIPALNSAQIYFKLIESGNEDAYLLLLDKGTHANLLWHDDGDLYLNTVHAFYKKYHLPFNSSLAELGDPLLIQCQPTQQEVEKSITKNSTFIQR